MTPMSFNLRDAGPAGSQKFRSFILNNPHASYRLRLKGDLLYLVPNRSKNYLNRIIDAMMGITAQKRVGTARALSSAFAKTLYPGNSLAMELFQKALLDEQQAAHTTGGRAKSRAQCLMDHDIKAGTLKAALERARDDVNAHEAFGASMAATVRMLQKSGLYHAAGLGAGVESMTPRALELLLKQMLKNARTREMISQCHLSPDEAVAIHFYGSPSFTEVQNALRRLGDASPEPFTPLVAACRSGFAKLPPLPAGVKMLYRREDVLNGNENGAIDGGSYMDPAFVSTTLHEHIARERFSGKFLLEIDVSGGAACRDVSALTGNANESEVLFLPGTRFKLLDRRSVENGDGIREIVAIKPE
jgi:hypothetical protein